MNDDGSFKNPGFNHILLKIEIFYRKLTQLFWFYLFFSTFFIIKKSFKLFVDASLNNQGQFEFFYYYFYITHHTKNKITRHITINFKIINIFFK